MNAQLTLHTNVDRATQAHGAPYGAHLATIVVFDAFGNIILRHKEQFRKGPTHALELPWVTTHHRVGQHAVRLRVAHKYRMPLDITEYAGILRANNTVFHLYRANILGELPEHCVRAPHRLFDDMKYLHKFTLNGANYITSSLAFRVIKLMAAPRDSNVLYVL